MVAVTCAGWPATCGLVTGVWVIVGAMPSTTVKRWSEPGAPTGLVPVLAGVAPSVAWM